MYSQRFGIVQREVKGPTPKVVIVRAKHPKSQGAEQQLERIQRSYQKHHAVLESIKAMERDRLKVEWDQHNDRKFVDSLVKARINDAMQGFIINTEERRNKLRELLASEENEYFTEMQLKEETVEEKKDRMKDKTRLLKEKKEKERQDFVAEKLDQQFRERCEELRIELLDIHQKKVCEERRAQIAFNEELRRRKLVEEQMFAKLWEEDRLAKEKREAEEARRQKELVENTRLGLNAQITGLQAQRRAAQQLKEEEARFLEKDKAQVKLENEQEKLKKQKTKQEIRTTLQKALQEKIEHIQQEYREEQDLDMKLVQRALQDLQEEADKKKQKRTLQCSPAVQEATADANVPPAAGPGSSEGRGAPGGGGRDSSQQTVPGEDPGGPAHPPRAAPEHPSHAEGVRSGASALVFQCFNILITVCLYVFL
ncbi:cilia- and flagella-associated protein 53 isoform X3 [Rousettus aegyptiacus]|uniref:cilia- and flagella-associated protein 53 isoform X3 n=1 Tax=Rousettus aegyptiacus TaxID=9407 RepID=UPI00168CE8CE|nr:cilia- and flagella-associated protein 53 isoform X3 [Rousettus aegyptiacus]